MGFPKNNPQKTWMKTICLALYYFGSGDCWYEDKGQSDLQKRLYTIWMVICNVYNLSIAVNVFLAHLRADLDEKEQTDLVQFTLSHTSIGSKIIFFYLHKSSIREVLPRVLEGFRSVIVRGELDKACVKKSVKLCVVIVGSTFITLLVATVDGIRYFFKEAQRKMNLSERNPQKKYFKKICQVLYNLGIGNCWYEENPQTKLKPRFWMVISNFYIFSFVINVFLAFFRTDLDAREKNDLVQFSFAHTVISGKIIFLYLEKKRIKKVLRRLLEGNIFTQKLDEKFVRRSVRLCVALLVVSYTALLTYSIDGVRAYLAEGVPIRTEVTYYPSKSDSGLAVNILRFSIQLHWWFAVSIMAAIDSICVSSLIIVAYKFKVLQKYFTGLRKKVLDNAKTKTRSEADKEFRSDFVIGIKMHDDALWCAKNVQRALGNLYSVQIFESVILLVMCLIKLVSGERNLIYLLANLAYIVCLILLTGAYMMPAGDITYEASMVSTAMFHSGWELVTSREVRVLAVLALQRSQAPVTMSAFGILTLSYTNFISVIRSSYSFFAVMY